MGFDPRAGREPPRHERGGPAERRSRTRSTRRARPGMPPGSPSRGWSSTTGRPDDPALQPTSRRQGQRSRAGRRPARAGAARLVRARRFGERLDSRRARCSAHRSVSVSFTLTLSNPAGAGRFAPGRRMSVPTCRTTSGDRCAPEDAREVAGELLERAGWVARQRCHVARDLAGEPFAEAFRQLDEPARDPLREPHRHH